MRIRLIYFEDNETDAERVKFVFQSAVSWANQNQATLPPVSFPIDLKMEWKASPQETVAAFDQEPAEFHGAVLDLLYTRGGNDRGFAFGVDFARKLRQEGHRMGIVGVSKAEDLEGGRPVVRNFRDAAALEDAGPYGTHGFTFLAKADLIEEGEITPRQLAMLLLDVLLDAGAIPHGAPPIELKNCEHPETAAYFALESTIEAVSKRRMKQFAWRLLGAEAAEALLGYVAPGLSGSAVVSLRERHLSLLMKLSKNESVLREELARIPGVGEPLRESFPAFRSELVSCTDRIWHASAAAFFEGGRTLLDYLRLGGSDASKPMERTFDALGKAYQVEFGSGERPYGRMEPLSERLYDAVFPSKSRSARISLALTELAPLVAEVVGVDVAAILAMLNGFLSEGFEPREGQTPWREALQKRPIHPIYCLGHGDLHARNILVSARGDEFRLVDPAECGAHFWPYDMARLTVDLIASGWDRPLEPGEADPARVRQLYDLASISGWRQLCRMVVSDSPDSIRGAAESMKPSEPPNQGLLDAIVWLREHLEELHPGRTLSEHKGGDPGWQFQLSMAVEFMRVAYRQELPVTKRVLGLAAAYDTLEIVKRRLGV
jgi:hypothetical protein